MNSTVPRLPRRRLMASVVWLLAGLLTLGPFLHSHFGGSHETGFHLDGVHAVHVAAMPDVHAAPAGEEESPALGVADSLPQSKDGELNLLGLALLWVLLPLLPARRPPATQRLRRAVPAGLRFRPGLPPPALAPPGA